MAGGPDFFGAVMAQKGRAEGLSAALEGARENIDALTQSRESWKNYAKKLEAKVVDLTSQIKSLIALNKQLVAEANGETPRRLSDASATALRAELLREQKRVSELRLIEMANGEEGLDYANVRVVDYAKMIEGKG